MAETRLLRQGRRTHGALHHGIPQDGSPFLGLLPGSVLVHQSRKESLVQRAPIHADPHRFLVFHGNPDNGLEIVIPAGRADVARVDAVLGQRPGSIRVLGQEDVSVVVEVAYDGYMAGHHLQTFHDTGH